MPTELRLRRRVQFYETDAAGIVHFSWFFRYMEEAEHALWRENGLSIHPPSSDVGWPRVETSCEFQRPLRFEQEFDVTIRVTEITRRTMTYHCEITQDEGRVATGSMKIACVTRDADGRMRSVDIPPVVAACFGGAAVPADEAERR